MSNLKDKVALIGMPGCGKSTLGRVLAKELNYNFYDMDAYIESISNRTVQELINESEDLFRDWETKACKELAEKKRVIISTGGGVVKRKENVAILKEECIILFIDRPIESISEDVDISSRPLLKDGKEKLYTLYSERYELYKNAADIRIANNGFIKEAINNSKKMLKNMIKE
jgi:shikimate kinase